MIIFTIPGDAVGKGRPRFARRGKGVVAFTPAKTESYEGKVGYFGNIAMCGTKPIEGAVAVSIWLDVTVPPSWSKKKRSEALEGRILPTTKPDLDNCAKLILDALNSIVWIDDKQVTVLHISKRYSEKPQTTIKVIPEAAIVPPEIGFGG